MSSCNRSEHRRVLLRGGDGARGRICDGGTRAISDRPLVPVADPCARVAEIVRGCASTWRGQIDQLILAGVAEEQIYSSGLCTAMHLDVLTSYRKEKEKAGRIAGVIRAN